MYTRTASMVRPLVLIIALLAGTALLPALRGQAECSSPPTIPNVVIEQQVTTRADIIAPSIGMDNYGRFAIGFQDRSATANQQHDVYFLRFCSDTNALPYGDEANGTVLTTRSADCEPVIPTKTQNSTVSLAIGPATQPEDSPPMYATWLSAPNGVFGALDGHGYRLRHPATQGAETTWTFDQASKPTPFVYSLCGVNGDILFNSAGMSSAETLRRTSAWTALAKSSGNTPGLLAEKPSFEQIRSDDAFTLKYAPCIATNAEGKSVVVWGEPENLANLDSATDIFIAQFDEDGDAVPSGTPVGVRVNSPAPTDFPISDESPAVSFVGNDIIVVWRAPKNGICTFPVHIYAKTLSLGWRRGSDRDSAHRARGRIPGGLRSIRIDRTIHRCTPHRRTDDQHPAGGRRQVFCGMELYAERDIAAR